MKKQLKPEPCIFLYLHTAGRYVKHNKHAYNPQPALTDCASVIIFKPLYVSLLFPVQHVQLSYS